MGDEDGPQVMVRRAEPMDDVHVFALYGNEQFIIEKRFGEIDLPWTIEHASLGITATDESEKVIGFAGFFDYPKVFNPLPEIPNGMSDWESWLYENYGREELKVTNTLWLSVFLAEHFHEHDVLDSALRTAFTTLPEVDYCLFLLPSDMSSFSPLNDVFQEVTPKASNNPGYKLLVCSRENFIPTLHVRPAKVEDHDDLVPIFDSQSEVLTGRYGEFFLAELIEGQSQTERALVAEVEGKAVGFMSLTTEVDVHILQRCFQLKPYDSLVKVDEPLDTTVPSVVRKPKSFRKSGGSKDQSGNDTGTGTGGRRRSSAMSGEVGIIEEEGDEEADGDAAASPEENREGGGEEEGGTEGTGAEGEGERRSSVGGGSAGGTGNSRRGSISSQRRGSVSETDPHSIGGGLARIPSHISEGVEGEDGESEQHQREGMEGVQEGDEDVADAAHQEEDDDIYEESEVESTDEDAIVEGEFNCFSVTVFCLDDVFECRAHDFLHQAFQMFPDKDYAILTLPHTVPEFQLLSHFTRVPPRASNTFDHVLYIFHKYALYNEMTVRDVDEEQDAEAVNALLYSLENAEEIVDLVKQSHGEDPALRTMVAEVAGQPIAVAVVSTNEDIDLLRSMYSLDDYIAFPQHGLHSHILIRAFAINPIFSKRRRFFLKELLRKMEMTCVYYQIHPDRPFSDVSREFVPVKRRRQVVIPRQPDRTPNYALGFLSRKLIHEPKVVNNARIVIVGASDCGLSFLETLLMVPYIDFTNLTLVSSGGLPTKVPLDENPLLADSYSYDKNHIMQVGFDAKVRVVDSRVLGLDRKKKAVALFEDASVAYDLLILTPGLQDQTLAQLGEGSFDLEGIYSMSDEESIFLANAYLDHAFPEEGCVVVYGATLDAYCCVQGLLQKGVSPTNVMMVCPFNDKEYSCFNDPVVDDKVDQELLKLGVQRFYGYTLKNVECVDDRLSAANFELADGMVGPDGHNLVRIECELLLGCAEKDVDSDLFLAMNESSLVYDGRLIVDHHFRTNDPSVRATGPVAKFSRKYRAKLSLEHYNSVECGQLLAQEVLQDLEGDFGEDEEDSALNAGRPSTGATAKSGSKAAAMMMLTYPSKVPKFFKARASCGFLPGGFFYMHAAEPSDPKHHEVRAAEENYGRDLVTTNKGHNYCRIHIDQYHRVESITYLGPDKVDVHNLLQVPGLSESYLNKLVSRYDEGVIDDFISFFQESWAMALFHDKFGDFRELLSEELQQVDNMQEMLGMVAEWVRTGQKIDKKKNAALRSALQPSTKRVIEVRLIDYLREHMQHLYMYHHIAQ